MFSSFAGYDCGLMYELASIFLTAQFPRKIRTHDWGSRDRCKALSNGCWIGFAAWISNPIARDTPFLDFTIFGSKNSTSY